MKNVKMLPVDYVTKDYDGFLEMMKEMIPTLTPEWTDTSDSDQGIVILQLLAYGLHVLGYYQDKAVNESLLPVAQTKKAILYLCKFLGYTPAKQTPSFADVVFTKMDYKLAHDLLIPSGTKVSTDLQATNPVMFETVEPLVIRAGELTGTVRVAQGESVKQETLGRGDGNANQKFRMDYPEVLEESITITTRENNRDYQWTLVENLFDSTPTDRHFMVSLDEEGHSWIIFGDGITGMRVFRDSTVYGSYRYGGGTIGNIAENKIIDLADTVVDGIESVNNPEPATGGTDYESLEKARMLAPRNYRTGGRIVTKQDLEDMAIMLPTIVTAKAEETYNADNEIYLYLANETFETLTQAMKEEYAERLKKIMVMNSNLVIKDVTYTTINLDVTAYIYDNFVKEEVELDLRLQFEEFLNTENFELGETIYLSKLVDVAFGVRGIKNVVFQSPLADIDLGNIGLPKLGTLTVSVVGGV